MKRFLQYTLLLVGLLAAATSCQEVPEEVGDPSLTLQQKEITIPAEGGRFTVSYDLENPSPDVVLKANAEKDWVSNIDTSVAGEISFDVSPLYGNEGRSCRVELIYTGVYPNPTLKVNQPVGMERAFSFNVKKVTASTIYMDVIPKDKKQPYVFMLGKKSYMVEDGLLEDDDAQVESDLHELEKFGAAFGATAKDVIGAFMYVGDQLEHKWSGVQMDMEYVAYAYGFDVETMTRTTEVCRVEIVTPDVQYFNVDFELDVEIDGPMVSFDITPKGYDGYYFYGVFEASACPEGTNQELMMSYCSAAWEDEKSWYSSFFENEEQGLHFIFNELAYQGPTSLDVELVANTKYVLWAVGMDDQALVNTLPVAKYFTTGNPRTSSNEFTISITNIGVREATVSVTTTNDDSYVAVITSPTRFSGKSDDEIMTEICDKWNYSLINGSMSTEATGLTPATDYEILVFGVDGGKPSTGLTRQCFSTKAQTYSDVEFSLSVDKYYSIAEVAALNPDWASLTSYDLVVPVTANYNSTEVEEVYISVMESSYFYNQTADGDEKVFESMIGDNPSSDMEYFTLDYGIEFLFLGIAKDYEGNYTKLWVSKGVTFNKEGTSPAQEFLDSIASRDEAASAPALAAMRVQPVATDAQSLLTHE